MVTVVNNVYNKSAKELPFEMFAKNDVFAIAKDKDLQQELLDHETPGTMLSVSKNYTYFPSFEAFAERLSFFFGSNDNVFSGVDASNSALYFVGIVDLAKDTIIDIRCVANLKAYFKSFSNALYDFQNLDKNPQKEAGAFHLIYNADRYGFVVMYRYSPACTRLYKVGAIIGNSIIDFLSDNNQLVLLQTREAEKNQKLQLDAYKKKAHDKED